MKVGLRAHVKYFRRCGPREAHGAMLGDGTYDVIVVDARDTEDGAIHLDLAVASGVHRGEVVQVLWRGLRRPALSLLAMPATLSVAGGVPQVRLDT